MQEFVQAFRDECAALEALLRLLKPSQWELPTEFFGWTIRDEIMHLHLVDLFARDSVSDPNAFPKIVQEVRADQASGVELSARMRRKFGALSPADLLATWTATWQELGSLLLRENPKRRVPWFGPEMSARSLAVARQMEVWAHGQDIFDRLGLSRINGERLFNICDLGVRTFGWSFRNRGLEIPGLVPRIRLASPGGASWSWNAENPPGIEGSAEDFALVVTQRRNVADTRLSLEGEAARSWMAIAQCFAGAPENPPPAGARSVLRGAIIS